VVLWQQTFKNHKGRNDTVIFKINQKKVRGTYGVAFVFFMQWRLLQEGIEQ
jgi:hypothetical protein